MNTLRRWGRFNLVGAIGMGLQIGSVAVFGKAMPGHPALDSLLALEITLIHNFVGHLRFTWRESADTESRARRFVRFQLSNGMVSLFGNVVAVYVLVTIFGAPLLTANLAAIAICSLVNFWLGNRWVFSSRAVQCARGSGTAAPSVRGSDAA